MAAAGLSARPRRPGRRRLAVPRRAPRVQPTRRSAGHVPPPGDTRPVTGAAVLVPRHRPGRALRRRTVTDGVADLRTGRPMNTTGGLRVGSVTKTFTATVVLQLAAERRLALDARRTPPPAGPDPRRRPVTAGSPAAAALQHAAGSPTHRLRVGAPASDCGTATSEPRRLVARALRLPRPPHTWHYAAWSYLVAGLIIARRHRSQPGDEVTTFGSSHRWAWVTPTGRSDDTPHPGPALAHTLPRRTATDGRLPGTDLRRCRRRPGVPPADLTRFATALLTGRLLPNAPALPDAARWPADPDRLWPGAYGLGLISSPLSCGGTWVGPRRNCARRPSRAGRHRPRRPCRRRRPERGARLQAELDFLDVVDKALCRGPSTEGHPA